MHAWNVSPKEAIDIQTSLAKNLRLEDDYGGIRTVAGVDVGFEQNNTVTRAAVVVLDVETLEPVSSAVASGPVTFPYVPGLLSFREIPTVLQALQRLRIRPDLLLCDGQGIAHPRRLGIAAHLGLLVDIPSVGVAKSRLIGTHAALSAAKGACVPLVDRGEQIGTVLRSRTNVKPLYISPGHRVSIQSAPHLVMQCITRFRLPETTRRAHALAGGKA